TYIKHVLPFLFVGYQFMPNKEVYQRNGSILHRVHQGVNLGYQVVVKYLENHTNHKTTHRSDKGNLHTLCNDIRRNITRGFNGGKGLHHPHNRSEEPEHGTEGDKQ